jgi:ComF family protein
MIGSIKSPANQVVAWLDDLLWLVYPELCVSCDKPLNTGEKCLCTSCRFHLPKTNFHLEEVNPIIKHFWGKVKVEAAASYFLFTKGEKVQHLIHQLKYRKRKDIGVFLGELYGYDLRKSSIFSSVDVIIPVPLHPKKLRKRGYNQSECFSEGLSQSLKVPYDVRSLKRKKETQTQTRKHRFERFENVNNVFTVTKPEQIKDKHILLVDDVITTGSTLVACAEALLDVPGTKVSIAAIAYA